METFEDAEACQGRRVLTSSLAWGFRDQATVNPDYPTNFTNTMNDSS